MVILGTYECYTKESTSQLILCLIDKFGMVPKSDEIKVIVADVACGLHPFLEERKHLNETFKLYSEISFVLDTFHGDKVINQLILRLIDVYDDWLLISARERMLFTGRTKSEV